jgi:hypothetical protein
MNRKIRFSLKFVKAASVGPWFSEIFDLPDQKSDLLHCTETQLKLIVSINA